MKKLLFLIVLIILVTEIYPQNNKNGLNKITTSNSVDYININQWKYYISNMGQAAGIGDPNCSPPAALWPGAGLDILKNPISQDGLRWGGLIDGKIYVTGAARFSNPYLQAGKIFDDGTPSNPKDTKYRMYKIRKGWESLPIGPDRDQFEKSYNEWPAEDGAPWVDIDGDGVFFRGVDQPQYLGDEVLWCVSNDLDRNILSCDNIPVYESKALPIGLEIQTTLYGFNRSGDLGDLIICKYRIINKCGKDIKEMYFSYESAMAFGNFDQYIGVDTTLKLAYGYDSKQQISNYDIPPAIGHMLLQGPIVPSNQTDSAKFKGRWIKGNKNLGMYSFSTVLPDTTHFAFDAPELKYFYNRLKGLLHNGDPMINPLTGETTRFILPGDPVAKTGWYAINGWQPGGSPDKVPSFLDNYFFTMGPINMAPFDTQEVVIGIIGAIGTDHLNSITELKRKSAAIQKAYDLDFITVTPPPAPVTHSFSVDQAITLYWDDNAENYVQGDPFLYGRGFSDTTYKFEGYRIWQYKDSKGTDPINIGVYDIVNDLSEIDDYIVINGAFVKVPVIMGPNEGLRGYINITQDACTKQPLRNGNSYYFGVTAYGYSKNSSPTLIESQPVITEVKPGKQKIDYSSDYVSQQNLIATQTSGTADGQVIIKILDPSVITNDDYEVVFGGIVEPPTQEKLNYSLIDVTKNDTLFKNLRDFTLDSLHKSIHDGFMVIVNDSGARAIAQLPPSKQLYRIKSVEEIAGKDGKVLPVPQNVLYNLNSTQKWMIKTQGDSLYPMENIDIYNGAGYNDYEIRFTESGSEYYTTGYTTISPLVKSDIKGKGKVPFEIWNKGMDDTSNTRMFIKTWDRVLRDSLWSRDSISKNWEAVFAYSNDDGTPYVEPIPAFSKPLQLTMDIKIGNIILNGELPDKGTVIKISTFKRILPGMKYHIKLNKAQFNNITKAKTGVNDITVFPNPYFGSNSLQTSSDNKFMRFTRLPTQTTIRIYSLAGIFVRKLEKNDNGQYLDWDLKNDSGIYVASGMYIAYVEMPGAGAKVLKLAVIMEKEHLNKF